MSSHNPRDWHPVAGEDGRYRLIRIVDMVPEKLRTRTGLARKFSRLGTAKAEARRLNAAPRPQSQSQEGGPQHG